MITSVTLIIFIHIVGFTQIDIDGIFILYAIQILRKKKTATICTTMRSAGLIIIIVVAASDT